MNILLTYIATVIPLVLLDAFWILVVAKGFYAEKMGFLFSKTVNLTPIYFFYLLYAFAVLVLVVQPAVLSGSWMGALSRGALLGLAAYSAYDLTNHATLAGWPLSMTLVDMIWGVTVTTLTSLIAYFIITAIK